HAGWCQACLAQDLLFARAIGSDRIFFICAACTAAGLERPTPQLTPWEQSITQRSEDLAPMGWTLAFPSEVERHYPDQVEKEADEHYEVLIASYPGFRFRSRESAEQGIAPSHGQ